MNFPFHLVIDYAHSNRNLADKAFQEFFKESGAPSEEQAQQVFPLFAEWLIFDFVKPNGTTFIAEYYLKNPDNLDEKNLLEFEQIIKTQQYGGFEIINANRGKWIELEHLFFGKRIKVFDRLGSLNAATEGTIIGRIARVNGKYYFVGSNPFYIPQSLSRRLKNTLKGQHAYPTPLETWRLFSTNTTYTEPSNLSIKQIKNKRKILEKNYQVLTKEYKVTFSFNEIVKRIYEENGKRPLDVWNKIMKDGFPEKIFIENTQLFQDIWNYFPHRILKEKSPVEMFQKLKNKK